MEKASLTGSINNARLENENKNVIQIAGKRMFSNVH